MADHHGFVRVAAASPVTALADADTNAERCLALLKCASESGVAVIVFPELALTGYTCHDLFHQPVLLVKALAALEYLVKESARVFDGLAVIGLPLLVGDAIYN